MSEHHTQGRQGQGSRRRKNYNRHSRRPRVPREEAVAPKPSFLQRILGFFGLGKKADPKKQQNKNRSARPNQKKDENQQNRNQRNKRPAREKAQGGVRQRIPSTPPTRNARLHVGNLSYEATESELEELFKGFGSVKSVTVIYNRRTYKSKGYAFVEMRYMEDAQKAAEVLHGQPFMGRELMVSAADEKQEEKEDQESVAQDSPVTTSSPAEENAEAPAEAPAPAAPEADKPEA